MSSRTKNVSKKPVVAVENNDADHVAAMMLQTCLAISGVTNGELLLPQSRDRPPAAKTGTWSNLTGRDDYGMTP